MMDRGSGRTKGMEYLSKNLDAMVDDDPDYRYTIMRPYDVVLDLDSKPWLMPTKRVDAPAVRIRMHPAQFERMLGMLGYLTDNELRESLGYRTPQEAAAFEVLQSDTREQQLRKSHPTVREAYQQYLVALKLCA